MVMLIEIWCWLRQPKKVWRFVCFVSSVVGLFCYALSSSFNDLFGKWSWWKILLYILFGFLICLAVLFAKAWERSTSFRLEAHMAFLVLMITSVYSFFLDKVVKGKPDAYSLVSCAAFSIMSLSLSRLSHLGFEVDLLYFFSGLLTVQLMKIKLWLVIVGGSFSYFLIQLRSALNAPSISGRLGVQVENQVVIDIDSPHSRRTNRSASQEADDASLENEDLEFLVTQEGSHSQQGNNDNNNSIMTQFMGCIEALKKEHGSLLDPIFKHVDEYLKANFPNKDQIPVPQLHQDDNLVVDLLRSGIINDLRESARRMVTAGLKEECFHEYTSCRREFLNEILSTFALPTFMRSEFKIRHWIKTLCVAERILLPNERRLCERVFEGSIPSEDMYHALPGIDMLRFRDSLGIFGDLIYLTYGVKEQDTVPGGGLHRITLDVMDYLKMIMRQGLSEGTMVDPEEYNSPSIHVAKITEMLESSLEASSKNYNNPALGYIFIINNWRFMELGEISRRLEPILGHSWLAKITTKIEKNLQLYRKSSWNKIVDFLKLDINESEPNVAAELMKDKLHSFNQHFDEICNVQSIWLAFDDKFREQIVKSIENILLPAYGNFLGRFHDFLGKHAYEYIEYGMFDIQDQLNKLFLVREK